MLRPWKLEITIDAQANKAIYLQIADAIVAAIQSGRLQVGDPLPGSRSLSQLLKVNRNTVVDALHVLLYEGWLVAIERKGTFVADVLARNSSNKAVPENNLNQVSSTSRPAHIVFDDGNPDSKIAPITELARAYRQVFSRKGKWQMMSYGNVLGDEEFRKTIAQMLNHQRGLIIQEDMLCITRGSQMAMYLTAHCLLQKGDAVVVENPGYLPVWKTFEHVGAQLIPFPVDEHGLCVHQLEELLKTNKKIKAVYSTAHRQYPTTVTLGLQRRMELIRLSNSYGFTIIEDDYDNEFHYGYRPIMPICSYKELQNYIYIGTLSKVVAPALRIGYLASNIPGFIQKVASLRKIIDVQSDNIMEQAILQLIKDGTLKRHIRRASLHYKAKRDFTAGLLDKYLKDKADYSVPEGGLAFWIMPKREIDWKLLTEQLLEKGIRIDGTKQYGADKPLNGFRLGYAILSNEQLEEGLSKLAALL